MGNSLEMPFKLRVGGRAKGSKHDSEAGKRHLSGCFHDAFSHHQPAHSSPQLEIAVTSLNSHVPCLFPSCAMSTFLYLTSPKGSMHVRFTLEVPHGRATMTLPSFCPLCHTHQRSPRWFSRVEARYSAEAGDLSSWGWQVTWSLLYSFHSQQS